LGANIFLKAEQNSYVSENVSASIINEKSDQTLPRANELHGLNCRVQSTECCRLSSSHPRANFWSLI